MRERNPLHDAPCMVREQVEAMLPLVARLYDDSPTYVMDVRNRNGGIVAILNERGYKAIEPACRIARDGFDTLEEILSLYGTPTPAHELLSTLLWDGTKLLALALATLRGLDRHPDPCMAAWALHDLLRDMVERCDSEDVRKASDFVYRNPAETIEQCAALIEQREGGFAHV